MDIFSNEAAAAVFYYSIGFGEKVVDVERLYDTERYRPRYDALAGLPLLVFGAGT